MEKKKKYHIEGKREDFSKIFSKLMLASHSIHDSVLCSTEHHYAPNEALDYLCREEFVMRGLATNVIRDRRSLNDVNWGACAIGISAYGVDYITGGDVNFGWTVYPECDITGDHCDITLEVYCMARIGGTLEKALIKHGFVEA